MRSVLANGARGLVAGAAGTTALNAATYLDMTLRARPASSTPQEAVRSLADKAGIDIPGDDGAADNRGSGLGGLLGVAAGMAAGLPVAAVQGALGRRSSVGLLSVTATVAGLVAGNAPMTLLGVTDPRRWSAADWLSDLLPHMAYGVATAIVLEMLTGDAR
jgi:hypothetical protein